jgi:release factor glutamine methyltransferase
MRLMILPGVFRPRSDTWQLARAGCAEALPPRPRILELCAGPAAAGVAVARAYGGHLTTVDVSRRATLNARLNAGLNGVPATCLRGDLLAPVRGERFDLVLANPPYVPGAPPPRRGAARGWDAGRDGRAVLDRLCASVQACLRQGGIVLVVHSEVCGERETLAALAASGLDADIADRSRGSLGPLLRARRALLEATGRLRPGQTSEDVVVIRGRASRAPRDRRDRARSAASGAAREIAPGA